MKSINKIFTLILIILFSSSAFAGYDLNDNCKKAYDQIMTMRFDDAAATIADERRSNPDNLYIPFLEFYSDMVQMIITDDPQLYDKIKEDYYDYIDIMEEDETSPYYKILKSEMLFHLSLANMKYGDKFTGARNLVKSNKLCNRNVEEHPDFWLNNKMSGSFNVVFAFVPSSFQWAAKIIGLRGDRNTGIDQLKQYHKDAMSINGMSEESVLFLTLGIKYGGNDLEAYQYINSVNPKYYENPVIKYVFATLCVRAYENDRGLELAQTLDPGSFQVQFYPYDYLLGKAKLNKLDKNADVYLKRFYNNSPGKDYKKEICYKIAQYYLISNNISQYNTWKSRVEEVGNDMTDRDREAEIEAQKDYQPIPEMVKVKLLFDGGYFGEAKQILTSIPHEELTSMPYELENLYWQGRISQQTDNLTDALIFFEETLNRGKDLSYWFAADAAFQIGYIYEQERQYLSAKAYYETCLEVNDSDWEDFIEIKAEHGLIRVEVYL